MKADLRPLAISLLATVFASVAWAQEFGRVHFQTSCTPEAQQKFERGLAMVHSFVYPDSVAAFSEAAAADPDGLGFEIMASYTGLAAVPARFALERQAWKEAAVLEPRGTQFPQAEAITYFARVMGSARGGDLAGADHGFEKLKNIRASLEGANQSYWAEQVEIQTLAAAGWIAQAKGQKGMALKFMRAAAELEDGSAKHIAMENRLYPMRELLADLLLEQEQSSAALSEYETSLESTPNRLRGLYGAAKAALASGQRQKATMYFRKLLELTKDADTERVEIQEAKAFLTPR